MISTIKQQTKDLIDELKRVDWPTQKKVSSATYTVVAASLFVGLYLWGSDQLIGASLPPPFGSGLLWIAVKKYALWFKLGSVVIAALLAWLFIRRYRRGNV